MCEYQKINTFAKSTYELPICTVTNEYCTYCLYGNANTYKKAKEAEEKKGNKNERKM